MPPEVWWKAPAKINLYLKVLDKRRDGYHNIASLFQMVSLYDRLRFRSVSEGISLTTRGEPVSAGSDNLIYQAAKKLIQSCHKKGGVAIELDKQIPLGAGLGGGSSDAAATLLGLKRLWQLRIPYSDLMEIALELGSDVPFFMGGPTAFVQGRGETVIPCRLAQPWWLLIVDPGFQVSTAWAYRQLAVERKKSKTWLTNFPEGAKISSLNYGPDIQSTGGQKRRRVVVPVTVNEVFNHLENSLEAVTGARYPAILDIKARLMAEGARGALMSGSGSTVFGIFSNRRATKLAADRLKSRPGLRVWIVKTLHRLPQR
jgi:4-diphosphocytidyl-2-C-methyl-D-erythritol kinase